MKYDVILMNQQHEETLLAMMLIILQYLEKDTFVRQRLKVCYKNVAKCTCMHNKNRFDHLFFYALFSLVALILFEILRIKFDKK